MATTKNYTFKDGLAAMAAKRAGIHADIATPTGDQGRLILNTLARAKGAKGKARQQYIAEVRRELARLRVEGHADFINAVQGQLLALQGRGKDVALAHVTPGEMVVPRALLTPALAERITAEAAKQGLDARAFVVGGAKASTNPDTGMEEFSLLGGLLGGIRDLVGGVRSGIGSGMQHVIGDEGMQMLRNFRDRSGANLPPREPTPVPHGYGASPRTGRAMSANAIAPVSGSDTTPRRKFSSTLWNQTR